MCPLLKGGTQKFPWNCALQELSTTWGRNFLQCVIPGKFFESTPLIEETDFRFEHEYSKPGEVGKL